MSKVGWSMLRKVLSVALMSVFVLVGSAANAVDEYPDPTLKITIGVDICNGAPIRFAGEASVSGEWTVTLDGVTRTGNGDTFTTTFPVEGVSGASAPAATDPAQATQAFASTTGSTLAALAPGESGTLTATLDYGTGTVSRTATVALPVCGDGADSIGDGDADGGLSGILPGTGGLALWIVVLAAVLIAAGATITRIARRRA